MSYVLQVALRIRRENTDAFMKKVLENAAEARKEPGCRRFDVLVDPKDPTHAMLYEIYDNEAAFRPTRQPRTSSATSLRRCRCWNRASGSSGRSPADPQ